MKWTAFAILAVITLVLQTSILRPYMAINSIWPDFLLIVAVHYALWGPWPDAAIGAWILGLLVGLWSQDRIGLHAFAFGAVAWAIIRVRQALFRDHPVTQIIVTFLAALVVQVVVRLYRHWVPGSHEGIWWSALFTALYTAACAPYLQWLLLRMGRWLGLRPSHRPGGFRA